MPESLRPYRALINEADILCGRLAKEHERHLACRRGCSHCCTDISVLAVEAYSIICGLRSAVLFPDIKLPLIPAAEGERASPDEPGLCSFLDQHGACLIYPLRPLICRTHGLPLLYMVTVYDEEGRPVAEERPQHRLFYCDLNFLQIAEDRREISINPEAAVDMEEWNRRLVGINEWFRGSADGSAFLGLVRRGKFGKAAQREVDQTGRVPLSSLMWALG